MAESDPLGARVLEAMRNEELGWLTTVDSSSVPQPNPIWFVWHDESIVIFSIPGQAKVRNIQRNPAVSFNLQSGGGLPVYVAAGNAKLIDPADRTDELKSTYWAKYDALRAQHLPQSREQFEAEYSATIVLKPTRTRGF
jgi:PPOX class probable F420-dependent enzyme